MIFKRYQRFVVQYLGFMSLLAGLNAGAAGGVILTDTKVTLSELSYSTVIKAPLTEKDLQGNWIGLPDRANDYCRLVLTTNHGVFGRSYETEKPMLYSVDSYKVNAQGEISFKISAASTNAYPILIPGKATSYEIRLTIKSPDGGWSHSSLLHKEDKVEDMLHELKFSMQPLERSQTQGVR